MMIVNVFYPCYGQFRMCILVQIAYLTAPSDRKEIYTKVTEVGVACEGCRGGGGGNEGETIVRRRYPIRSWLLWYVVMDVWWRGRIRCQQVSADRPVPQADRI